MSVVVSEHLSDAAVGALCVLGRGIERVQTPHSSVWRPTRYLEQPAPDGGHSGTRQRATAHDATALIAGSNANLLAACTLYDQLRRKNATPALVIFAAGRPAYLAQEANRTLTEGIILQQTFTRRVRVHSEQTELVILAENRNTFDDINSTLSMAAQRRIAQIAIITLRLHVPRAMEFARQAPASQRDVHVAFIPSEDLLQERYAKHPCILRAIDETQSSQAYQRTAARETHGLHALRTGTYWTNR